MKSNWITFESAEAVNIGRRILVKADNICEVDEMTKHKTRVHVHGSTWIIVKGDFDSVVKRIAEAAADCSESKKWISVKDQYPGLHETVLVRDSDGYVACAYRLHDEPYFFESISGMCMSNVVEWREIPE